jgi:hypothetical protein
MANLKEYTETELLKFINDAERDHNEKKEIIKIVLTEYNESVEKLNNEIKLLDDIELRYVTLMEELSSRAK